MLELPHPLLGDDADRQRAVGRVIDGKEYLRWQYKKSQDQQERDDRPGRLEPDIAIGRMIAIDLLSPPVTNGESEDQDEHWSRQKQDQKAEPANQPNDILAVCRCSGNKRKPAHDARPSRPTGTQPESEPAERTDDR